MNGADRPLELDFLRAVFESMGAGLFITDTSGRLTASNPWADRLLDRDTTQMLGQDLHDLLHRQADGRTIPRDECRVLSVMKTGSPAEGSDECYLRADGTTVPIIWAATPLVRQGRVEGAVIVFHDFSLQRRAADQQATHLMALEELTERLTIVAEISAVLSSTLDVPKMLHRLVRLLVPELGDWAVVDLRTHPEADDLRRIVVRCEDHEGENHGREDDGRPDTLLGPLPPLTDTPSASALARVMRGGRPLRLEAADLGPQAPLARAHRDLFDRLGGHSAVVVPLSTTRQVFGALTVARRGERPPCTEADLLVLADIGRRAGLVLDNAQLFDQQRQLAETMQRQLLTPLPQVDHLQMAARYQPAESAAEIGGDWYDAFLLADGVTTMVIGDVVGHDLKAAAHMAEVRNMLRALAWDRQEPPSLIMRRLDEAMTNTSDAPMATAVFARVEGEEGGPWQLHWVNAGHPPPLLVTYDGHARYLEAGHGPLLGMDSALHLGLGWPDAREELPARSTLLLYTDGLVESRTRSIDGGLAQLRRHAADLAHRDVEDFCDELLTRLSPSGDDVALLALRIPERGEGRDDGRPPRRHSRSPAAPNRAAPGSQVEDTEVRDTS
ncbi:SpoIIE family protein phosphatase [Streptomyces sp. Tu 2975]|uniref:SpoIIE family protein phosphatase n=1 Tax=Streptomyces sp. Tu 2975 TaxID=2676871 RepID=UPI001359A6BE|nr:SpoIIE family protein phosphatase [Streptomyces sp. Tu 2975]QIP88141.1 SpoIIE family protein phosphatase [Streptomyces sp. Tu 2975]